MKRCLGVLVAAAVLSGCGGEASLKAHEVCGLKSPVDQDSSAGVFEYNLRASKHGWSPGEGVNITGYAFNEQVPGPLMYATVGSTMKIHFTNELDQPTTVHWHGLRIPDVMDGVPAIQNPVHPGETFTYEFVVPDAGLYWYHPHMDTDLQMERGLSGPMLIVDPNEPETSCQIVALDDVLVDESGDLAPRAKTDMEFIRGRLGNHIMGNGKEGGPTIKMKKGAWKLVRFVNMANTRHFELAARDHKFRVIGRDIGYIDAPYDVSAISLAPGERINALVYGTGEPEREYSVQNFKVRAGLAEDPMGLGGQSVATFSYASGETAEPEPVFPVVDLPQLQKGGHMADTRLGAKVVDGRTVLTINDRSAPDIKPIVFKANELATIRIINNTMLRHPMHLHGQRFQLVEYNGREVTERAWKDTTDVGPHDIVTIASPMDNPGRWMYHCHIVEHGDGAGMMSMMLVE